MSADPIVGRHLMWTFDNGQMKGKTFEHTFDADGTVHFRCTTDSKMTGSAKYEIGRLNDNVYVISYRVDGGFTLTTVLDLKTGTLVSMSSNDKQLDKQTGTFEMAKHAA